MHARMLACERKHAPMHARVHLHACTRVHACLNARAGAWVYACVLCETMALLLSLLRQSSVPVFNVRVLKGHALLTMIFIVPSCTVKHPFFRLVLRISAAPQRVPSKRSSAGRADAHPRDRMPACMHVCMTFCVSHEVQRFAPRRRNDAINVVVEAQAR